MLKLLFSDTTVLPDHSSFQLPREVLTAKVVLNWIFFFKDVQGLCVGCGVGVLLLYEYL